MEGDTLTPVAINVAHTIMLINRLVYALPCMHFCMAS